MSLISSVPDLITTFVSWLLNRSLERERKRPYLCLNFKNISINEYLETRGNHTTILITADKLTTNAEIDLSEGFDITYQSTQKAFCEIHITNANPDACVMDLSIYINDYIAFDHLSLNKDCSFTYFLCFDMSIFNKYILKKPKMVKKYMIKYIYNGINEEKLEQHTILHLNTCDYEPEIELIGKQISSRTANSHHTDNNF